MSCCGGKRAAIRTTINQRTLSSPLSHFGDARVKTVRFEYTGEDPYSVHGTVTGKLYSFQAGATVEVDARDAISLSAVPTLRKA